MLAILALETGHIFHGRSIGLAGISVGEVVFNTALTGYQEILTDPSYTQQIITFTYPHIGNTGINYDDMQAEKIYAAGLVVKSLSKFTSNWRATLSLADFLQQNKVIGIEGVDTRGVTILLRERGALRGCIMAGDIDENFALHQIKSFTGLNGVDLASQVSTAKIYQQHFQETGGYSVSWPHIVLLDFGVKKNIIDSLTAQGCSVTVVPAHTTAEQILALQPDGIVLSNGPGDPAACNKIIKNIQAIIVTEIPLLGICLGHQLLALALGAKTYKMNFGHHGSNHPVQDLRHKRVIITSQNHGFAVDESSISTICEVTHRSLFDYSLQGFKHKQLPIYGFQGHPEAAPGPHDALSLMTDFVQFIRDKNAITAGIA